MFAVKVDQPQPAEKKPRLNEEDLKVLMAKLKARKKFMQNFPLFKLVMSGNTASLSTPKESRIPVSIKDVQDLLLCSLSGNVRHLNKWFYLTKWEKVSQTVVLVVDNVSVNDIEENQELFPQTLGIFEDGIEMINSNNAGLCLNVALAYSPITNALKCGIAEVYNSLKEALDDGHIFSITDFSEQNQGKETSIGDGDSKLMNVNSKGCSKTELMLNVLQLVTDHYPFPGHGYTENFLFTKDKYEPATENSPMFAVDCEWCLCYDGTKALARVAIVDENLDPVYHTYVRPDKNIRDYATKWSGITPELLMGVQKRLCDVQQDIRNLLPPDAILVGHSLRGDLFALELFHPYVIDSSVIYNMTGCRYLKSKLQFLSKLFCNRDIQTLVGKGHDPNEDAMSSMELVLMKLRKGFKYGDACLSSGGYWEGPSKEKILSVISNSIFKRERKSLSDLDLQDVLLMKFFTYVQSLGKSALLITQPKHDQIYRPKTPLHQGLFYNVKAAPVEIIQETELQGVVPALESRMDKDLVFIHTIIEEDKTDQGHLKKLDKVIADVYNKLAMSGMMIVIFGGKTNPMENGVCMIRVKKPCRADLSTFDNVLHQ